MLSILGEGDELVVVRLDRLARSVADLADIVRQLEKKGASLRCIEQPVDTGSAAGRAFVGMLAVFAEFETGLRRERQMEGIAKAKREGKYKGRRRLSVSEDVARLAAAGKGATAIAKALGIGVATVHRRLAEQRLSASAADDKLTFSPSGTGIPRETGFTLSGLLVRCSSDAPRCLEVRPIRGSAWVMLHFDR